MSEPESNVCEICGGARRVDWVISFEECHPVEMRFTPETLATNWRLCSGHPESASKHDGKLDGDSDARVQYGAAYPAEEGIYILDEDARVYFNGKQALSLLTWLEQNRKKLRQMAKEQEE